MNKFFVGFSRFDAASTRSERQEDILCPKGRYRCLRRRLLIILLLVGVVPLSVMASLGFVQYRALLREDTNSNVRLTAASARQTIEAYCEKLTMSIQILSNAYSFQDLIDQEKLDRVFAELKQDFPGVVDLSVIDSEGIQQAYAGPYNLVGKNYSKSIWYNKTLARKLYISEIFMGFRHVPHFVIAVGRQMAGSKGHWILRASIDTEKLDRFLAPIYSEVVRDVFLVNQTGKLQNTSRYHGKVNDVFNLPDIPPMGSVIIQEGDIDRPAIHALSQVQNTPWILVLEFQGYAGKKTWVTFKQQVWVIFLTCLAIVIVVAFWVARHVALTVKKADEDRNIVLAKTEHTNKLASIGRLAAGVAHEINNPLAIINEKAGLMKDLLEQTEGFVYRDKFLGELYSLIGAVDRSRTITHRLLGFARRMDVKFEPVQINDVINEVYGFLSKEALYRNIEIIRQLQPELPFIKSDRGQLQQIFLNIINNAIDAVAKDGEIRIVSGRNEANQLQVDIIDNGPGMSNEVLNNIFEPFFSTKMGGDASGAGLGLSITYGLVKKLGGDIIVESVVGSGSIFTLVFPLLSKDKGETIK